jgi:hypothetical protein
MGQPRILADNPSPEAFNALTASLLREGHRVRFRAPGQSMMPTLRDGDVLCVTPLPAQRPRLGAILLYTVEGRPIAHRVLLRWRGGWLTRGDAYRGVPERVPAHDALGVVQEALRGSRRIQLDRPATRWRGLLRAYGLTVMWILATLWESVRVRWRRRSSRSARGR